MRALRWKTRLLPAAALAWAAPLNGQAVPEWSAFNDHRPSKLTSPNATGYDMLGDADRGPLKNYQTGADLPVRLVMSSTGYGDFVVNLHPLPGSPAFVVFDGIVDLGNSGIVATAANSGQSVTMTFTGLDPAKSYSFRGTAIRGNQNPDRWSVYTIAGADSYRHAHDDGSSNNNLITKDEFPAAALTEAQVALATGQNLEGSLVGWDEIDPGPDGSFSIVNEQYTGATPFKDTVTANAPYGYALAGIRLSQHAGLAAEIMDNPAAQTTVTRDHPLRLSARVRGSSPRRMQWHKAGAGAISGATQSDFTVPRAAMTDSGDYYLVVSNDLNEVTSGVARVTVTERTAPLVILSWPSPGFAVDLETAPIPDGPWTAVSALIVDLDTRHQTAVDVTGGSGFFRLKADLTFGTPARIYPPVADGRFERAPGLSSDGLSLYMSSEVDDDRDIWVMTRTSPADPWGAPQNLSAINTAANESYPEISADDRTLIFSDWMSTNIGEGIFRPGSLGGGDLWLSTRSGPQGAWQTPVNPGEPVNSANIDSTPALSGDGLTLIFTSDRPGGFGDLDLWMTTRTDASNPMEWSAPVNIGETVNSASTEWSPALSHDGLTLYFISSRTGGSPVNFTGIWWVTRTSTSGTFGSPVSFTSRFPQFQDSFDPCPARDGSAFFFASRGILGAPETATSGPAWHLWQVPVMRLPALSITGLK